MTKEKMSLEEITFELDSNAGSLGLRVEILEEIAENLKHLQEDMDQAVHRGTEKFSYREHHREVRILAELMYYVMQELSKNYKETRELNETLRSAVREKNELIDHKK